jgi:hypothetical protein
MFEVGSILILEQITIEDSVRWEKAGILDSSHAPSIRHYLAAIVNEQTAETIIEG